MHKLQLVDCTSPAVVDFFHDWHLLFFVCCKSQIHQSARVHTSGLCWLVATYDSNIIGMAQLQTLKNHLYCRTPCSSSFFVFFLRKLSAKGCDWRAAPFFWSCSLNLSVSSRPCSSRPSIGIQRQCCFAPSPTTITYIVLLAATATAITAAAYSSSSIVHSSHQHP